MIEDKCKDQDDKELVALSLNDSQYFYCLMKKYEDKLSRYVRRISSMPEEDIADVIQESFVRAYQNLNDCDCTLKFSSWMYRIVHNQTINFIKKHRREINIDFDDIGEEFAGWLTADTDIEKEVIDKHFGEYIRQVMDRLKPEFKEVLVLKFLEEKDYQEISDILQKPMGTVATLISRAKIQFRKIYEKEN